MDLSKISKQIEKSLKADKHEFVNIYLEHEKSILDSVQNTDKVFSEIYLKENDKNLEQYLKFSAIFSDVTFLNNTTSERNDSHVSYYEPPHKYFPEIRDIVFPSELGSSLDLSPSNILPCYLHRTNEENLNIYKKYRPLIKNEKLFIRPLRAVAVSISENRSNFYYVDPNTNNNIWKINQVIAKDAITIDNGLNLTNQVKLMDLTLPYFNNISIENLTKVLIDETDILSSFRVALKKSVKEGNIVNFKEYRNDVIRPEIDTLNRKFKKIQSHHRVAVVGSLGWFTLTLFAAAVNNTLDLSSFLTTTVIPSIGGFGASEMKFNQSMDELKDNPYFLLWKISSRK